MQTFVISVGSDITINDISAQLKKIYPAMQIATHRTNPVKKFAGTGDLNRIRVADFNMHKREDLYDR